MAAYAVASKEEFDAVYSHCVAFGHVLVAAFVRSSADGEFRAGVDAVALAFPGVPIVWVDVDRLGAVAAERLVAETPAVKVFWRGMEVDSMLGARAAPLRAKVERWSTRASPRGPLPAPIVASRAAAKPAAAADAAPPAADDDGGAGGAGAGVPAPATAPAAEAGEDSVATRVQEQLVAMGFAEAAVAAAVASLGDQQDLDTALALALSILEGEQAPAPVPAPAAEPVEPEPAASKEEKVAAMKAKLAARREAKAEAARAARIEAEKRRREQGKQMQAAREAMEDQQRRLRIEERRREKREQAMEKLRQKVELLRDKADRLADRGDVEGSNKALAEIQLLREQHEHRMAQEEALRALRADILAVHDVEGGVRAVKLVHVLAKNALTKGKDEAKYCEIKLDNPAFVERVGSVPGAVELLVSAGFVRDDATGKLVVDPDAAHESLENLVFAIDTASV